MNKEHNIQLKDNKQSEQKNTQNKREEPTKQKTHN